MHRDIDIRIAAPTDAERIHAIHTAAARTVCAPFYEPAVLEGWLANRSPAGYLRSIDAHRMFVAELESGVTGFGEAVPGEVVALFVDPAFGGRGVGSTLLRHALKLAGDGVVRLESTLNAVSFYEHFGFRLVARSTLRRNEVEVPVVVMERVAEST